MRVLLAGGGSGGSAAPVIAVAEALALRRPDAEFLYVGTRAGPERAMVEAAGLPYATVTTGRLRRYLTWRNLVDPALVVLGVLEAFALVRRFRPTVAFGAGGFATVPPLLAARLAGAGVAVHQQDVLPGLANRILAPFAARKTVAFEDTARRFWRRDARAVGNPVRAIVLAADPDLGRKQLQLDRSVPLVLVMGGGTGALRLNQLVAEAARTLVREAELVHLTGSGKAVGKWDAPRYHPIEFLAEELPHVLAAADVVVTRAGMSSLAEIGALHKAAIVVPMPQSHQEANARLLARHQAGIVRREADLTPEGLADEVKSLLGDEPGRRRLGAAAAGLLPPGAADRISEMLDGLAG